MNILKLILIIILCNFISCQNGSSYSRNTNYFKDTEAYDLAIAVENEDLIKIEEIVKNNPKLLNYANPVFGSNVVILSMYIEKFNSFKKLLELGADPNFINPLTKYSVLIEACQPRGKVEVWDLSPKYIQLLLDYGADANYSVDEDFTNINGYHVDAISPLMRACGLSLEWVKLLIKYGADPSKAVENKKRNPFSRAISSSQFEIINYFIDSLNADVNQPMYIRDNGDTLTMQWYLDTYMSYIPDSEGYKKKQELIQKINAINEKKGINIRVK